MSRPAARFARFTSSSIARSAASSTAELGDTMLAALADLVDAGLSLAPGEPARLVRVRAAPADGLAGDELEVGFRPVEAGGHPLDELVGFRRPVGLGGHRGRRHRAGHLARRRRSVPGAERAPRRPHGSVGQLLAAHQRSRPPPVRRRARARHLVVGDVAPHRARRRRAPPLARPAHRAAAGRHGRRSGRRSGSTPSSSPPLAAHRAAGGDARSPPSSRRTRPSGPSTSTPRPSMSSASSPRVPVWPPGADWPRLRRACAAGSWSSPELDAAIGRRGSTMAPSLAGCSAAGPTSSTCTSPSAGCWHRQRCP